MQNLRFNIAAGETKNFGAIGGAYMEIIEAAGPISIGLYDSNGSQSDDARDIYSGFYAEGKFSGFEVYSASAQTVELLITNGRGGSRRQPGNVKVIDAFESTVGTYASTGTGITAFTAAPVIAAGSNTAGIMVRAVFAEVKAGVGGSSEAALVAAPSLPTSMTGPNMMMLARVIDQDQIIKIASNSDLKKRVPTGWGIYHCVINSGSAAARNALYASVEVL
jgi:hypothetical protein